MTVLKAIDPNPTPHHEGQMGLMGLIETGHYYIITLL